MIRSLNGTLTEKGIQSIVLDVSGVGYGISCTTHTLQALPSLGQKISLYTYLAIREHAHDLYGFLTQEERDFFELLLTISGVGPKSALGILNSAPISTIKEGVASGDPSYLTKVSGIGKKSAEKIIVELRDKLGDLGPADGLNTQGGSDAIEALTALGYSAKEARDALREVDKQLPAQDMIKEALKLLSN